jgi:hypothetical protein|tara:strand:+ start:233 stop:514 length:282 start_codon:yes stop_codon:yes gene_type:complete
VESQVLRIQSIKAGLGFVGPANLIMLHGMFAMTSSENYNALKKVCKEAMNTKTEPDPSEQLFEDDPRAAKEVEYGKVQKNYTHMETKSILDEF